MTLLQAFELLHLFCYLQDGPAYVHLFVTILRDIFKEETVEYVLALIYEILSGKLIYTT